MANTFEFTNKSKITAQDANFDQGLMGVTCHWVRESEPLQARLYNMKKNIRYPAVSEAVALGYAGVTQVLDGLNQ